MKKNRRRFLSRSIRAMIVTPALAAARIRHLSPRAPSDVPDEVLPGDPGTRDTESYGSIGEE
ncbi:MAG: hypothetical protein V3R94_09215 [Acidobacteriota bacterium]